MSVRSIFPSAKEPDSHYFLTISRGGKQRKLAVRPAVAYAAIGVFPLVGAMYLAATAFLFFRDDMIAALMTRQARQQYAYEDRLAAMRVQLDRVTSRQLLDQDSFEGKVQHLIAREAQLETRTAIVAALGERFGATTDGPVAAASAIKPAANRFAEPVRASAPATGGPAPTAFAPLPQPLDPEQFRTEKPRPDGFELRTRSADEKVGPRASLEAQPQRALTEAADATMPMGPRLELLATSLDRIERRQIGALAALAAPAARKAEQIKAAISEAGLSPEKISPPQAAAVGGPYIPVKVDPNGSPFERQLSQVQGAFASLDRLSRALPYLPLRKPLAGALDITSGFGYRIDPFLGRAALHSGLDMRAEPGTPARATASGKVVAAGWSGGYGNMVEIDHGNGMSTRYGHLSAILVSEGDNVKAGETIGKVGSTGRSTGPHLHYEVRVDDDATDPTRFVRAARLLTAKD